MEISKKEKKVRETIFEQQNEKSTTSRLKITTVQELYFCMLLPIMMREMRKHKQKGKSSVEAKNRSNS